VLTVITLLFLTGLFEQLPEATLAAVVIAAVIELVDVGALRRLYRAWTERLGTIYGRAARADFAAALAALLGVLIFDTLPGLFIGIGVSLLLLLYRASRPNVAVLGRVPGRPGQWADTAAHPENRQSPGVVVARVESGLFFANADHVAARLRELAGADGGRAVVLDAGTVPFVDVTAADMLATVAAGLHRRGVVLLLARDIGQVRDVLRTAGPDTAALVVHPTVDDAVAATLPAGSEGDPR
jgi:sulfate permease, SulP family